MQVSVVLEKSLDEYHFIAFHNVGPFMAPGLFFFFFKQKKTVMCVLVFFFFVYECKGCAVLIH